MLEGVFFRDPNDFTSRTRVGTVGRELGDILRWRAPEEALAVYDVALARLAEIRGNVSARRDRALLLANFSYALRRLNRAAEARSRLVEALAIAMWIEWSRALPNSPFVLRQLALPDGEAGSRS